MGEWKSTGQAMTFLNKENQTSKEYFKRNATERSICPECEDEFDSKYFFYVPNKEEPIHYDEMVCDSCKKKFEDEKIVREIMEQNEKRRKERIKEIFDEDSLMNPKLKNATFENYDPTNDELKKAKEIAARFAQNFNKEKAASILFIGSYGTGKSHLSVSITKELMKKDFSCLFISTPKLLTKLRSTYNKDSAFSEDQIISRLINVDCLVLDDIGSEQTKVSQNENDQSWATSKLFEIIDSRIGKHTVYTSNFQIPELKQRLGGRNFSRMMEDVFPVNMNGEDYRMRNFS